MQEYLDNLSSYDRGIKFAERFDTGESEFLMLLENHIMIGASVFGKSQMDGYPKDGEITAIYLQPQYIGNGYGALLLKEAEQKLCTMGYRSFVLDVLSQNYRAVRFYIKNGYIKVAASHVKLDGNTYPLDIMRKVVD